MQAPGAGTDDDDDDENVSEQASIPPTAGGKQRPRYAWLGWPISAVISFGSLFAFFRDTSEARLPWLFWIILVLLAVFYCVVLVIYLVKGLLWLHRRFTLILQKARSHDELRRDLDKWKQAAATATTRAEDAEARVDSWELDTLHEGRRRLLAELRAVSKRSRFTDIEVGQVGGVIVIGAEWRDEVPHVNARYLLKSRTLGQVKAVLETVEIRANRTVLFALTATISDEYRAVLISHATSAGRVPGVDIVPPNTRLEREPLWPEK